MVQSDRVPRSGDVALIVGGGPGISASCARFFAANGEDQRAIGTPFVG